LKDISPFEKRNKFFCHHVYFAFVLTDSYKQSLVYTETLSFKKKELKELLLVLLMHTQLMKLAFYCVFEASFATSILIKAY